MDGDLQNDPEDIPRLLAKLDEGFDVWHQCGAATRQQAEDAYRSHGIAAKIEDFIDDMSAAYGWADMVICRSGALTVSELAAAGLGAILVPYPASVDDHQTLNARYLVNADAAVLIQQKDLTPAALAAEITRCAQNRKLVLSRAVNASELARPDATAELVGACLGQIQEQAA